MLLMKKIYIFFSLPVGPVDVVASAVGLDCNNVSEKRQMINWI